MDTEERMALLDRLSRADMYRFCELSERARLYAFGARIAGYTFAPGEKLDTVALWARLMGSRMLYTADGVSLGTT